MIKKKAQGLIEYTFVLVAFVAAIILMSVYLKRAVQGNWHSNIVSLFPEAYDPRVTTIEQGDELKIEVKSDDPIIKENGQRYAKKRAGWVKDGDNKWKIWSK
jgi:hypothetical protein